MAKEQKIEVEGKVIEATHELYKVDLGNGIIVTARVSGKIRMNMIRILPGDLVTVAMSPTDLTHGIITYRNNKTSNGSTNIANNKNKGENITENINNEIVTDDN